MSVRSTRPHADNQFEYIDLHSEPKLEKNANESIKFCIQSIQ